MAELRKKKELLLDYLMGEGLNAKFNKQTVIRLDDIERLPSDEKISIIG